MSWPKTNVTITDQDGELVAMVVEYCCWTFCAWPELLALLASDPFRKCRKCQMVKL